MADRIADLRQTRWYDATLKRWRLHQAACLKLGCPVEPFHRFAEKVLNTPEKNRDGILVCEPIEQYEPFWSFAVYRQPKPEEMNFQTQAKRRKK